MNQMSARSELNVATKRTVLPAAVVLIAQAVLRHFDVVELSAAGEVISTAVLIFLVGLYYRLARVLEVKYPTFAWLLLGSKKVPAAYVDAESLDRRD